MWFRAADFVEELGLEPLASAFYEYNVRHIKEKGWDQYREWSDLDDKTKKIWLDMASWVDQNILESAEN